MSYESKSEFPAGTPLKAVLEVIEMLGYKKCKDVLKSTDQKASYDWYDPEDYRSHSGISLTVHQEDRNPIVVYTLTNASRSYWDLLHQNKTLRLFRDLLGAPFTTDAGRNRYWRPDKPLKPIESGCYLARWRFHNAVMIPRFYLRSRGLDSPDARKQPTGLAFIDEMNPRLFSNNLLLPYLVAVWEDYFKNTFSAVLKYSENRFSVLKNARLPQEKLESIAAGTQTVEDALAESFSFQRPKVVTSNFKLIDSKFDLASAMRKPYRRRKQSLFGAIDAYVDSRNEFVHTGTMDLTFVDTKLDKSIDDFEVAVDRCYAAIAKNFGFKMIRDY